MITSGVIITLIICATLIILSVLNTIGKAYERKRVKKELNDFMKAFPTFNKDNKKDDYFSKF